MASTRANVLILGNGEMGHALSRLLAPRHTVRVWARRPPPGEVPLNLDAESARADVVLFCLPAVPHVEIATRLGPRLSPDAIAITIAKGLDNEGRVALRALADALPTQTKQAALYGPMIAEEILADRDAFACLGTSDGHIAERLESLFAGSRLHLQRSSDPLGLSWCGVLKNVYALLFGMADELKLGDNVRGYLACACTRELADILDVLGAHRDTAITLAGLGDLVTTATSSGSRHHETGRRIARGESNDIACEGVHTLQVINRHDALRLEQFSLWRLARDGVQQPTRAASLLRQYFRSIG